MAKTYDVAGVRFKKAGKIYYFNPNNLDIELDDHVIVETARGLEYGTVVLKKDNVPEKDLVLPLKPILKIADEKDEKKVLSNKKGEKEAYAICVEKIKKHNLPMKLLDVEYTFDRGKAIFYFTADGRVDFRELVKDLAGVFRTRIELRQVGVRDEAKVLCGYGCCGRKLCCCSFLGEFEAVSIKMAKNQNLSLNSTKISGVCGRLMCCLKYEDEGYTELRAMFPKEGSFIGTPNGRGRIIKNHLFKNSVTVAFDDGGFAKFNLDEIKFEPAGYEEVVVTEDDVKEVVKEELLDENIKSN